MRTGRWVMRRVLPGDPELHDRPLLAAVGDVAALAGDPVRLPVVRAGGVEPERREVEEARLVAVAAAALPGLADRLLAADEPVRVLALGLAHVDPDLATALRAHTEGGGLAGGHGRAGLRRERRDAVLGGGGGGRGDGEHSGDREDEDRSAGHAPTLTTRMRRWQWR